MEGYEPSPRRKKTNEDSTKPVTPARFHIILGYCLVRTLKSRCTPPGSDPGLAKNTTVPDCAENPGSVPGSLYPTPLEVDLYRTCSTSRTTACDDSCGHVLFSRHAPRGDEIDSSATCPCFRAAAKYRTPEQGQGARHHLWRRNVGTTGTNPIALTYRAASPTVST